MHVTCYGSNIEIPDLLIDKYARDFEYLPGKGMHMEVKTVEHISHFPLEDALWQA